MHRSLWASHLCLSFQGQYLANKICSAMVTCQQSLGPLSTLPASWEIPPACNIVAYLGIYLFVCFKEKRLREVLKIILWGLTAVTSEAFICWSQRENQGTYVKAFCSSCYLWPMNYSIQCSYKHLGIYMEVKKFQQNSRRNPPSQVHVSKKRSYWLQLRMCVSQILPLAVSQSFVVWSMSEYRTSSGACYVSFCRVS